MNYGKVLFWSITVALGGFLFGFDTAVISGGEQAIQKLWGLSDAMIGQMVAMALYGTIIGALLGGIPADRWGRKTTLFWIAVLYLISAVGSALAPDIYSLMIFRFVGGLGVGASSVAAPMYISEIAPRERRGQLTAMFQFNIVLGILMAYLSNWLIGGGGNGNWRWMLGVEAFPALAFVFMILFVPRSPRWLIVKRGLVDEARKVLEAINPDTVEEHLAAIHAANKQTSTATSFRSFLSGRFNLPILLAFLFALFNQVSGINAVIYYAPRIFSETGMGESVALLSSVGIGVVNLVFTMVGLALIDRMGRRFLMYIGSFGYIISLATVSIAFFTGAAANSLLVPILLFVFIAAHAIGQGAVIWVFISEIFPNEVRSFGNSLGSGTHWVFAAIIAGNFPFFAGKFGGGPIFAFFALMMVFQLLFVWKMMPETKGVSLEDLEKQLIGE
ncbi:MAG: sugar porter family MFS transporter [Phaeodactylibacter sp.]|nr:sugar porter family MFS transporter [Phaeodactylibacter sp.]MCB9272932.1 sugar porter family MFS transporter [Lewinellaceae bacterium]